MFSFYNINIDYLEFLHNIDNEVEYSSDYRTSSAEKVFLGIITDVDGQKYFIPLTSAKAKHTYDTLVSKNHMLIYETVSEQQKAKFPNKFYKATENEGEFLLLISCLLFNKAIPVLEGQYHLLNIPDVEDSKYRSMLIKEYSFCLSKQDEIQKIALNTIKAIKSGKRVRYACNLNLLEDEMGNFED